MIKVRDDLSTAEGDNVLQNDNEAGLERNMVSLSSEMPRLLSRETKSLLLKKIPVHYMIQYIISHLIVY